MITIKDAKFLANELILGTDIKSRATETVRATYAAFVSGDEKAEKVLVTLWEICATDKPTLAIIRSIFNRVTKKMHKELGIEKRAMVVKDGKLSESQERGAKGDGASGDGAAETTEVADTAHAHHMAVLAKMFNKTDCVEERAAIKYLLTK